MTRLDVLVVGSGPAGSAAAAAMARAGASVLLVEAAEHPRPKACAEYASPRILEELECIGLDPVAWAHTAVPLEGMELHAGRHAAFVRYSDLGGPRTAWGVNRRRFDALLASHAAAAGADLRSRSRVSGLVRDAARVRGARIQDVMTGREQEVRADWVIGADGARSTVSRLLGVDRPVRFPRRLGLVAHFGGVDGFSDHGEMHAGKGRYVGLAPTPDGEVNVGMALPLDGGRGRRPAFEETLAMFPAVTSRLAGSRMLTPVRGAAPIGHRVSRVAGPGWLLVGDAAGFVDPFTGEGIHRALRSARAASRALFGAGDPAAAYVAERRRAFSAKTALTWAVQAFLAAPWLLEHAVARLESRPAAAVRLGSALGDCRPATSALSPRALFGVLAP